MKYAAYEDYKSSASDWLGSVPSHWHVDRLKWSTNGCYNGVWGDEPNDLDDLICVRVADFDRDRFVVVNNPPTLRAIEAGQRRNRLLQKHDLLIEKSGGGEKQLVGCVVQFTRDFPAVCSNFVARLPVARGCDPGYLTYLHSAIYAARLNYPAIKQTTGIQNLDSGEYLNILATYPPIEEQQTIARFLDAKTAQIDALLAQKRQLIDKLKEKRQALIVRTVTRGLPPEAAKAAGLEPNPEMKDSGVDWLSDIPSHWCLSPLKRIVCTPITDGPHETPEFPPEGVPFVSAEAVQDGQVRLSSMRGYISQEDHKRYSKKYCPQKNDIFIVKSGSTTGKVAIVDFDDEFNVWSPLAAVRCDLRKALPEFVFFALSSEYFQGLVQVSWSFGTQPNIGMGVIGNLPVALPPVSEQRMIAAFLKIETTRMNDLIEQTQTGIARLSEYRQALITSAVTGKIDVRHFKDFSKDDRHAPTSLSGN